MHDTVEDDQDELTGSYTFEQLSEKAKQKVRNAHVVYDDWWDYEDFIEVAKRLGITIGTRDVGKHQEPSIFWSGFSSQGDGPSWAGIYRCNPTAVKDIVEHAPHDEELKRIAEALTVIQVQCKLEYGTTCTCRVGVSGRYSHSHTMSIDEIDLENFDLATEEQADLWMSVDAPESDLIKLFRDLADWMYHQLEAEYDYLHSDEAIAAEEHLYDGDGERI